MIKHIRLLSLHELSSRFAKGKRLIEQAILSAFIIPAKKSNKSTSSRNSDESWCDYILRQAVVNPNLRQSHKEITLRDFATGMRTFQYRISLCTEVERCLFKVKMTGNAYLAPDDRRGHMRDGLLCYWLYDNEEKWFTVPADTIGKVCDDEQYAWTAKAGGMTIKLYKKGGEHNA